jgi:hypothetical protein
MPFNMAMPADGNEEIVAVIPGIFKYVYLFKIQILAVVYLQMPGRIAIAALILVAFQDAFTLELPSRIEHFYTVSFVNNRLIEWHFETGMIFKISLNIAVIYNTTKTFLQLMRSAAIQPV